MTETEEKLIDSIRESTAEDYARTILYGKTSAGVVTAVQVDANGKLKVVF